MGALVNGPKVNYCIAWRRWEDSRCHDANSRGSILRYQLHFHHCYLRHPSLPIEQLREALMNEPEWVMGHFADAELAFSLRVDRGIAHPEYTVSNLVYLSNNEIC